MYRLEKMFGVKWAREIVEFVFYSFVESLCSNFGLFCRKERDFQCFIERFSVKLKWKITCILITAFSLFLQFLCHDLSIVLRNDEIFYVSRKNLA